MRADLEWDERREGKVRLDTSVSGGRETVEQAHMLCETRMRTSSRSIILMHQQFRVKYMGEQAAVQGGGQRYSTLEVGL